MVCKYIAKQPPTRLNGTNTGNNSLTIRLKYVTYGIEREMLPLQRTFAKRKSRVSFNPNLALAILERRWPNAEFCTNSSVRNEHGWKWHVITCFHHVSLKNVATLLILGQANSLPLLGNKCFIIYVEFGVEGVPNSGTRTLMRSFCPVIIFCSMQSSTELNLGYPWTV